MRSSEKDIVAYNNATQWKWKMKYNASSTAKSAAGLRPDKGVSSS
jgi:YD repeat-containing protein